MTNISDESPDSSEISLAPGSNISDTFRKPREEPTLMPLTIDATDTDWSQVTASAGQKIAVLLEPTVRNVIVYFLAASTKPDISKLRPTTGDDALYQRATSFGDTRLENGGLAFQNLDPAHHLWARSENGPVRVFASASI